VRGCQRRAHPPHVLRRVRVGYHGLADPADVVAYDGLSCHAHGVAHDGLPNLDRADCAPNHEAADGSAEPRAHATPNHALPDHVRLHLLANEPHPNARALVQGADDAPHGPSHAPPNLALPLAARAHLLPHRSPLALPDALAPHALSYPSPDVEGAHGAPEPPPHALPHPSPHSLAHTQGLHVLAHDAAQPRSQCATHAAPNDQDSVNEEPAVEVRGGSGGVGATLVCLSRENTDVVDVP